MVWKLGAKLTKMLEIEATCRIYPWFYSAGDELRIRSIFYCILNMNLRFATALRIRLDSVYAISGVMLPDVGDAPNIFGPPEAAALLLY